MNQVVRIRRAANVLTRVLPGEVLVGLPGARDISLLTGTGSVIWQLLEVPRSPDEVVSELALIYEVVPESIAEEVGSFLGSLQQRGVITITNGR